MLKEKPFIISTKKVPMSKFNRKCTNPYEKNFKTLITMRKTEKLRSRKGLPCQLLKRTLKKKKKKKNVLLMYLYLKHSGPHK